MSSSSPTDAPHPPKSYKNEEGPLAVNREASSERSKPERSPDRGSKILATNGQPQTTVNGPDDGADSEAETLIDSPVKRREAEKAESKAERPTRSRIGSLPVPGEDDDESDSRGSPIQSVEPTGTMNEQEDIRVDNMVVDSDKENASSDVLSSPRSTSSNSMSRRSSHSRAFSERPDLAREHADSPNPRKRKHRASSVTLPNKRTSNDSSRRATRSTTSDHAVRSVADPSVSPKLRSHRRAVSTQSAIVDGITDNASRKRNKAGGKEAKHARSGWAESDGSSETASTGNIEPKRPQRGVGRSTSTPGRPPGREHKRHVNKYGFTKLAEACEQGDLESVKEWRDKDPDQLELAEFAQNKPLQIAALNGNDEVVAYLIDQGCQIDCANVDKDTPLIDAAENGHLEVVKILLQAGVDPLRQNLKGQQALDVVTDDIDDADHIRAELRRAIESWNSDDAKQRREEEEVQRHQAGTNKGLHFMARSYENLLKLVTVNDRSGVREFLDARVPVDNAIVAAAARTGDLYLVNMLLAEMNEKKAFQKAEKPMLAVLGTSHFDMVKALTELDQFNPLYTSRAGKTWPELADEKNGPSAKQEKELLQRLYDNALSSKARRSSSPVVKRENGKRRHVQPEADGEDSEDGEDVASVPKRKNGRRLMSRRDMRAANGKNASASESESEESSLETDLTLDEQPEEARTDEKMKPPDSPVGRRTHPGRRKSVSIHPSENATRTRRRSSSLRETKVDLPATENHDDSTADNVTVQIEHDANSKDTDEAVIEAANGAMVSGGIGPEQTAEIDSTEKEARDTEEKQKKEQEAREQEEEKAAGEEREKERLAQAAIKCQDRILACLPPEAAHALKPSSDFRFQGEEDREFLLSHFTPLLVTKEPESAGPHDSHDDEWVLNAQVAPLLGTRGLELLLPTRPYRQPRTFSGAWSTFNVFSPRDQSNVDSVMDHLFSRQYSALESYAVDADTDADIEMASDGEFAEELHQLADAYNGRLAAKQKFAGSEVDLYCVRLTDVLRHLDPLLEGVPIQVRSLDWSRCCAGTAKSLNIRGMEGVAARFSCGFWDAQRRPYRVVNDSSQSTDGITPGRGTSSTTEVTVIREK